MLLITLSVPQGESFIFALDRVLDTFIGTLIAIFINFVLRPPEKKTSRNQRRLGCIEGKRNGIENYAGRCSRRNLQAARTKINALSLLSFYVSRQLVRKAFCCFLLLGKKNLIYLPAIDENR